MFIFVIIDRQTMLHGEERRINFADDEQEAETSRATYDHDDLGFFDDGVEWRGVIHGGLCVKDDGVGDGAGEKRSANRIYSRCRWALHSVESFPGTDGNGRCGRRSSLGGGRSQRDMAVMCTFSSP